MYTHDSKPLERFTISIDICIYENLQKERMRLSYRAVATLITVTILYLEGVSGFGTAFGQPCGPCTSDSECNETVCGQTSPKNDYWCNEGICWYQKGLENGNETFYLGARCMLTIPCPSPPSPSDPDYNVWESENSTSGCVGQQGARPILFGTLCAIALLQSVM